MKLLASLAAIGLLLPACGLAQYTTSVEGTVVDQSGAAIPEARLTLTNVDTGVALQTASNSAGYYRFPDVPPGKYRLRTSKTGFQTVMQESIALESGPSRLPFSAISSQLSTASVDELSSPAASALMIASCGSARASFQLSSSSQRASVTTRPPRMTRCSCRRSAPAIFPSANRR